MPYAYFVIMYGIKDKKLILCVLKYMKKLPLFAFFSLLSMATIADPWLPETGYTTVTNLYPAWNDLSFMVADGNADYSTCDGGKRYAVRIDHPNYQVLSSAIMMAFVANKPIRFNLMTDAPKSCSYPINRALIGQ